MLMSLKPLLVSVSAISLAILALSQKPALADSSKSASSFIRPMSESLTEDYAQMRSKQVKNVRYNLFVNVGSESESFSGVTTIKFELAKDNKNDLTIDFDSGAVSSLKINGKASRVNYEKWFITIAASELTPGKNTIEIAYERPYATDGTGLHRFVDPEDGEVYLYTDFEPYDANRLFPHFDQPDLKATYTLSVVAPAKWQVISSVRESSIKDEGKFRRWSFPKSAKFSSYIFSLHAGNYAVWEDVFEDIPLRLFARQSVAKYVKTEEWFVPTKQSFGFFNKYFDIKYPFKKYDQVIVPDFNSGAMENVAAVTFAERYISRGKKTALDTMRLANVIAHEMAHMWFGDLVTMRWWNGLWLNESFATYMANLALSRSSDFENVWEQFYDRKQWGYELDDSVNTHPIELPVASTGVARTNFDGITYSKGGAVLKQLPFYLGEDNFRVGVSNYLKRFSYRNTELDDFIAELGRAANRDLKQWTQDWLYMSGLNTIKVEYECTAEKIATFNIHQTAPSNYPTLREQRIQIGLYKLAGSSLNLASVTPATYKGEKTQVTEVLGKPCPDLVFPNQEDWGYVKVELDGKSLTAVQKHINSINSTMARLMIWQSLSDSVKDAKLSADNFLEFAMANIEGEKQIDVIRKIGDSIGKALNYLSTATRLKQKDFTTTHLKVEDLYWSLLQIAEPGSDIQKYFFERYVRTSKDEIHLANIQKILLGKLSFKGLNIDQDMRWGLVNKLNSYQYGDYEALLVAEKAKDKSDSGQKYAIISEVLRPDPKVKKKWFDTLINNPDKLNLSTLRYVMGGLFPAEQKELETPYKSAILDQIAKLNKGDDLAFLGAFAGSLLPQDCTDESVKELATLVDEYKDFKPQVLKKVRATHEESEKCVKALTLLKQPK